jgi:DNA-binding transcriptional LysR family regulator
MNLDQLQVFLTVSRHLHFSRAADELYITQPAVSAAISKLETEFGVKLFHRIGRRVELTDAGRFLVQEGTHLRDGVELLERRLLEFNALRRGMLSLGASFTVGNYWLAPRLHHFSEAHPGIDLCCEVGNAELVLEGTSKGRFDLGFVSGSLEADHDAQIVVEQVGLERLELVVGRSHPWFGVPCLPAERLAETRWILRERGSGAQQMFELALAGIGIELTDLPVMLVLNSSEMVKAVVLLGKAAAALPGTMVEQDIALDRLWAVKIETLKVEQPILMVKHQQRYQSKLISTFEDLIRTR